MLKDIYTSLSIDTDRYHLKLKSKWERCKYFLQKWKQTLKQVTCTLLPLNGEWDKGADIFKEPCRPVSHKLYACIRLLKLKNENMSGMFVCVDKTGMSLVVQFLSLHACVCVCVCKVSSVVSNSVQRYGL